MPELPEVETTRRGLDAAITGRRIAQAVVRRADLRTAIPPRLVKTLIGARITAIRRRAKYLLIDLDNGEVLLVHLGMSGSFRVEKPAKTTKKAPKYTQKTHDHVILTLENGMRAIFHDPRRFGLMTLLMAEEERGHPLLAHLGPEPLSRDFSPAYLAAKLATRSGPIKPVLMDQKLVVGVGNIYASESLFLAKIHPATPAKNVQKQAAALIAAIRQTLNAAIQSGGSTLRDYVGATGEGGYFQHHFLVYGRAGKPCLTCATPIETGTQAGRATYWCPHCQPIRASGRKT